MTTKKGLSIIVILLINILVSSRSNAAGKVTIMSSDVSFLEPLTQAFLNAGYEFELLGPDMIESRFGTLHYCKSIHPEDVYDRYPADFVLLQNDVDDTVAGTLKALNPDVNVLIGRQVKKLLRAARRGRKALEKYFAAFEIDNYWNLLWSDEFDYKSKEDLLKVWNSSNGPTNHTLCSRWIENVELHNGFLRLVNHKETRGGQNWTSGSISTKDVHYYGYYECRYKYAAATGTNNSFWIWSDITGSKPEKGELHEIDINEGHWPSRVNMNFHQWNSSQFISSTHKSLKCKGVDFSEDYHVFAADWSEKEIVFYLDGKETARFKNSFAYSPANVYLSLAIFDVAGPVTDAIDGTYMEVDYVRIYKHKP